MACVHTLIIRVLASQPAADLLRAPMRRQLLAHHSQKTRVSHDLRGLGPFPAPGGQLAGPIRPVEPVGRVSVAPQLAAHRRGAAPQGPGHGPHAQAPGGQVRQVQALPLAQVPAVHFPCLFHGATVPVHARWLITTAGPGAPVAPHLARAFAHPHQAGGLREIQPGPQRLHIRGPPGPAHPPAIRIGHALKHPRTLRTIHSSISPIRQVLQRSLEPAYHACGGGGSN